MAAMNLRAGEEGDIVVDLVEDLSPKEYIQQLVQEQRLGKREVDNNMVDNNMM